MQPLGEARLVAVVSGLFRRFPALLGFSVHEAQRLYVSDLAIHPWFDEQRPSLRAEIVAELVMLVMREPRARDMVKGRTFARALH